MAIILTDEMIQAILDMPTCLSALENSYGALAQGQALNRPRADMHTESGDGWICRYKTMDGVLEPEHVAALRVQADLISWPRDSQGQRQVKHGAAPGGRFTGLLLLFSTRNGELLAMMQDSYLQRMRVGATNGLAAKYMARPDASQVGLLGAGFQAGAQLMALAAVRPISGVRVFSPNPEHRQAFAESMQDTLGIPVVAVGEPAQVAVDADILCSATNSMRPVIRAEWLRPGMHITCLKRYEVEPAVWDACDTVVIHARDGKGPEYATAPVLASEEVPYLRPGKGYNEGLPDWPDLTMLVSGRIPGRQSEMSINGFLNNLGLGTQFAAVGYQAYLQAKARGIGIPMNDDWLYQRHHS